MRTYTFFPEKGYRSKKDKPWTNDGRTKWIDQINEKIIFLLNERKIFLNERLYEMKDFTERSFSEKTKRLKINKQNWSFTTMRKEKVKRVHL